jgi:hypothetical protein
MSHIRHQTQRQHRPLGVTLLSIWFLLSGILILLIGIGSILLVMSIFTPSSEIEGPRAVVGAMVFSLLGGAGSILGFTTTLSGLGLVLMKRWGLGCSYATIALWITFNSWFIVFTWRVPENLGMFLANAISIVISVSMIVYLSRKKVRHRFIRASSRLN